MQKYSLIKESSQSVLLYLNIVVDLKCGTTEDGYH